MDTKKTHSPANSVVVHSSTLHGAFRLERFKRGGSRSMSHRITDEHGKQYGPTFGDIAGPRDAQPWLDALQEAHALGMYKVEADASEGSPLVKHMLRLHAENIKNITQEDIDQIASLSRMELMRRALVGRDWHKLFASCLDGIHAIRFLSRPAGCWFPRDIRCVVEVLVKRLEALEPGVTLHALMRAPEPVPTPQPTNKRSPAKSGPRLKSALLSLRRRIAAGQEYPDAHYSVARKYNVDADALQKLYDEAPEAPALPERAGARYCGMKP